MFLKDKISSELKRREALYNQIQAKQGFEDLDKTEAQEKTTEHCDEKEKNKKKTGFRKFSLNQNDGFLEKLAA